MSEEFKKYRRTNVAEMRPVTKGMSIATLRGLRISVAEIDADNGSPKEGDMIARNPKNHEDQWLIAEKYFKGNFAEIKQEESDV